MMNRVRKSASPTSTVLGGVWPVPKAWRSSESTTMIRTNDVIINNSEGSSVRAVMSANSCSVRLYWVPPPVVFTFTMGMPCCAKAHIGTPHSSSPRATMPAKSLSRAQENRGTHAKVITPGPRELPAVVAFLPGRLQRLGGPWARHPTV